MEYIQNIFKNISSLLNIDPGKLGDIEENNLNIEVYKKENIAEISLEGLEIYPDLSLDIIYTSILKRVSKSS